jgi:general secretion pathway protein B
MSFILDALKKSEIERQRQSVPGLIDVPSAKRRRAIPAWVWVLAGLLGINMAVLLVLLIRSPAPAAPAPSHARIAAAAPLARELSDSPARTAAPPQPAQDQDHFSPLDSTPVYAPEIPVPDSSASDAARQSTAATSAAAAAATPHADVPARSVRRADPVLNDEPSDDNEMLPSISELNLTGTQSLPDIHLDVRPVRRIVSCTSICANIVRVPCCRRARRSSAFAATAWCSTTMVCASSYRGNHDRDAARRCSASPVMR